MAMEMFHHTLPDGYEITLPKMENIKTGIMRKTRKLNPGDQLFTLMEQFLSEEDLEHVDELERHELQALTEAWREESNIGVGES